jgi:hypothetical protein
MMVATPRRVTTAMMAVCASGAGLLPGSVPTNDSAEVSAVSVRVGLAAAMKVDWSNVTVSTSPLLVTTAVKGVASDTDVIVLLPAVILGDAADDVPGSHC